MYQWKVIDGVLCSGWVSEVDASDHFQPALLGPAPDATPNAVELIGLEIDNGPLASLLRSLFGGKDVRDLSVVASPATTPQLSDGSEVKPQFYHPELDIHIEERSLADCFAGDRWDTFVTAVQSEGFLRFYTKLGFIGPWAIDTPRMEHLPPTVELVISKQRLYAHEGIPFRSELGELLVGIHERSAERLEAAIVAQAHLPGFERQLKAYRVRAARLRARRSQIRADLVAILESVAASVSDSNRFSEILMWIGSTENKRWPHFLAEQLSGLIADCEQDPDGRAEFEKIPQALVGILARCINRRQRQDR